MHSFFAIDYVFLLTLYLIIHILDFTHFALDIISEHILVQHYIQTHTHHSALYLSIFPFDIISKHTFSALYTDTRVRHYIHMCRLTSNKVGRSIIYAYLFLTLYLKYVCKSYVNLDNVFLITYVPCLFSIDIDDCSFVLK